MIRLGARAQRLGRSRAVRIGVALLFLIALSSLRALADTDEDDDSVTDTTPSSAPAASVAPVASVDTPTVPVERRAVIERELDEVLAKKSYSFCHDPHARLDYSDESLCSLAEAARPRCPAFAEACKRAHEGCTANPGPSHPISFGFAELIGILARALLWVVTIAIVLFIALELIRALSRRSREDEAQPYLNEGKAPDPLAPPIPNETDVTRLLARARTNAARGDFREAVDDLYRALLRYLDARALIQLHPSRTNGDYARQLAPTPDLARSFRELARELERVQFGRRVPTAELFGWLESRIVPIVSQLAVFALVVVCLLTTGCHHRDRVTEDVRDQWCGTEPSGYGAFCALMSDADVSVRQRVRQLDSIEQDVSVVVVVTGDLPKEQWNVLKSWTEDGGTLILAAHPSPLDDWAHAKPSAAVCGGALKLSPDVARGALEKASFAAPYNNSFRSEGDEGVIASCNDQGYVVQSWPVDGSVISLPSPELLSNASLAAKDNALLITALVHPGTGVVEIVGPWTGSGAANPFAAIAHSGLGPWVLQVLALLAVFAWSRGRRFGTARALVTRSRHAFVEHVRALGERYRTVAASRFVLVNYGAWAFDRLRDRLRSTTSGRLSDLAEAAARQTGQDTAHVMRLLVDVRSAQEDASGAPADHLRALRALAELLEKLESSGEHRRVSSTLR